MRRPGMISLLMLWGASLSVEASGPLNLFRPDTGQRTTFTVKYFHGGTTGGTVTYSIVSRSGDSAEYHLLRSPSQMTGIYTLRWSQGKWTARPLLRAGTLDTNGIHARLKTFPADFKAWTATSRSGSGFTLQHVVEGFVFDTLLVACQYEAATDQGDNCDFVTPSGVFVYSNVEGVFGHQLVPDAATLAAMGGKPVSTRVVRNPLGQAAPAFLRLEGFDFLGRVHRPAPAETFPDAPARESPYP